jgi:hypothetical protein
VKDAWWLIDYRRANARTLRAVYYVRSADDIIRDLAGSALVTLVDACAGFNQIVDTDRAMGMLEILARSGRYLSMCLMFGPVDGPEHFALATDRVYVPGRNRKMCLRKQWQIHADDAATRAGRVVDGVVYTKPESRTRSVKKSLPSSLW